MRRVLALCLLVSCSVAQHQAGAYNDYADYEAPQQRPAPRAINRPPPLEAPKPTPVAILKQINRHNDDGSYTYGFEGADGTFKIETKFANGDVKGKYGFVDPTGEVRTVEYGADRFGFQPAGKGITVAPPTLVDESLTEDYPEQEQYRPQAPKPKKQKPRTQPQPQQQQYQPAPVQQQYQPAPVQQYSAAPAPQQYRPAPAQAAPAPQQYRAAPAAPAPQQYRPAPAQAAPAPQQYRAAPAPQQYRPAPAQAAPQHHVSGASYEQQISFAQPAGQYQVVEQQERHAAPVPPRRIQVAGAAPLPPRAEIPGAAPARRVPQAAAPAPSTRAGPSAPQQYRPAPQAAAPARQQYFQPAPQVQQYQAAPQAQQYQPAPAAPQRARAQPAGGSILDQLAKDYALPQGGSPLHDITFSGF